MSAEKSWVDLGGDRKIIARVVAKPDMQAMLTACRKAGLTVDKLNSGYEVTANGQLVLKGMNGSRGYLVRLVSDLFGGDE